MTIEAAIAPTFESWRARARTLLAAGVPPSAVAWTAASSQASLPGLFGERIDAPAGAATRAPRVPARFMATARRVAHHASDRRWDRLYRLLWRLVHEDDRLLEVEIDDDVAVLRAMDRQVRREVHRMKAFVRFRRVATADGERFVAWYRPEHPVLPLVAPFFVERFRVMRWSLLTPHGSAHWDGSRLLLDGRETAQPGREDDALEILWQTYYEAASNPARLNLAAMGREMPRRLWPLLPETRAVAAMVAGSAPRVQAMIGTPRRGAGPLVPRGAALEEVRAEAAGCDGCELHRCGSRVVFGEGPSDAGLVLVGEQPGDLEDRSGRPFVGPAGEVLDGALAAAGIDRHAVYLTNAVKHFRFTERGKRRIHQSARMSDVVDCRPWLEAELSAIRPETIVCLGATAARSLLGAAARVWTLRGRVLDGEWARRLVVTIHPSAVLRATDASARLELYRTLVADLRLAAGANDSGASATQGSLDLPAASRRGGTRLAG